MASTDVGSGSVNTFRAAAAAESSNLASVPQIMYRSLQQTTIGPPNGSGGGAARAGVTNDRIPLQRLNDDEYDEVRHPFSKACLQHSQTVIQPCKCGSWKRQASSLWAKQHRV